MCIRDRFKTVIKRPFDVADNTSKKTHYISRASHMDREIAQKLFLFFCNDIVLDYQETNIDALANLFKERKDQMLEVLRTADSDIIDFKIPNNAITTFHRTNPSVALDVYKRQKFSRDETASRLKRAENGSFY